MDKLQRLEARAQKLQEQIARAKKEARDRERKIRTTALCTIGACWESMLEDPATKDAAMLMWDRYFSKIAPDAASDRRCQSLEVIFGLEVPKRSAPHTLQPSSSESDHE